jgi:protein subunit release factor B
MKEKLFSVRAKDCTWQAFRGSGSGGQNRNKNSTAIRCIHDDSGAVGVASEHKSQKMNKRAAFRRMASSEKFRKWVRYQAAKMAGHHDAAERYARTEINSDRIRVEIKDNGKWTLDIPQPEGM